MRRESEPTNKKSKDQKKKLITVARVTPVAAASLPQSVEKCEEMGACSICMQVKVDANSVYLYTIVG